MKPSRLRLAVDTNVLLDLADEIEDVLDAISVIEDRLPNADRLVPPSVLDELAYLTDFGQTAQLRQSAGRAIQQLRTDRRVRPILELPLAPEMTEQLAGQFRRSHLLPTEEVHDSRILAEAVVLECGTC